MGRRVFRADPVQPGNEASATVDFRPSLDLAGEIIAAAANVDIVIKERESGAVVTSSMYVSGSMALSDNAVATFRYKGLSDNYDYVATLTPKTNLRPTGADEADVIIPVRSRPRRTFAPVGP